MKRRVILKTVCLFMAAVICLCEPLTMTRLYAAEAKGTREITEAELSAKNYVVYAVNCGASVDTFPTYSIEREEAFSDQSRPNYPTPLINSKADQAYTEEAAYGLSWGYTASSTANPVKRNGSGTTWPYETNWEVDVTSSNKAGLISSGYDEQGGIIYKFQMPDRADENAVNKYNLVMGFYTDGKNRNIDIYVNGAILHERFSLVSNVKFQKYYQVEADENNMIEIRVANNKKLDEWASSSDNVKVQYIELDALPVYTNDDLKNKIQESNTLPVPGDDGTFNSYEYNREDLVALESARTDAVTISNKSSAGKDEISEAYIKLQDAYDNLRIIYNYTAFTGTDGERIVDNNGTKIQAHGGQVQKVGDTWYLCGEDKTNGLYPLGVHIYSSKDLYNWTDCGLGLQTVPTEEYFREQLAIPGSYINQLYNGGDISSDEDFKNIYGDDFTAFASDDMNYYMDSAEDALANVIFDLNVDANAVFERPKMIYNESTDRWIIWYHSDGPKLGDPTSDTYSKARAGVAISLGSDPAGPYKYLGSFRLNGMSSNGGMARDMSLYVDKGEDKNGDGVDDAYMIYSSVENAHMYVSLLDSTYTKLDTPRSEAVEGVDYSVISTNSREAPAPIKYNGKYYMLTSGCTGWAPNAAGYSVADNIMGPYTWKGDPCVDGSEKNQSAGNTFNSQSTCIIPYDVEEGLYIYMGDRWFNPDSAYDLGDSRYIWTPLQFDADGNMTIYPLKDWTLEDLKSYRSIQVEASVPKTATSIYNLFVNLPETVGVKTGANTVQTPVEWDAYEGEASKIGTITITGKLPAYDNTVVKFEVEMYPDDMVMFIDCGTDIGTSSYFTKAKELLGESLLNDKSDQQYRAGENTWGYTAATIGTDAGSVDMGRTTGGDILSSGWWAGTGKNIDYAVTLPAGTYKITSGYQDWWSQTRGVTFSVRDEGGQELGSTDITVNSSGATSSPISVTLSSETKLTLRASKKSGEGKDPIISWIAIRKERNTDVAQILDNLEAAAAVGNKRNVLPQSLQVKTAGGETVQKAVQWNNVTFKAEQAYQTVTVKGVMEGYDDWIDLKVRVVPKNLTYYIVPNCTLENPLERMLDIASYDLVKSIPASALLNSKNDQASQADSWGYLGGNVGASGENLTYLLPLKAGTYTITSGHINPDSSARIMNIDVKWRENGVQQTQVLAEGLSLTGSKPNALVSGTITLKTDAAVTFTTTSVSSSQPAVLRWIGVAEVINEADKSELSNMLSQANSLLTQTNVYTQESLKKLKTAVEAAKSVYDSKASTQDEVNAQVDALRTAIGALVKQSTKPISSLIIGSIAEQKHTGKEVKPSVTLKDGTKTLKAGTDYVLSYANNVKPGTAKVTITGKGSYTGSVTKIFVIIAANGKTYTQGKYKYKVTNASTKSGTVTLVKPNKATMTSVKVVDKVKIGKYSYKVTGIAANAFKNNKKLKTVKIGKNVKNIGANAFMGCKVLRKITVSSKNIKSVGKNALKGIHAKAAINVPAGYLKKYKKIFSKKGQKSSVVIK